MGTHLCENHALELVDGSRLPSCIRSAVQIALARGSDYDLRTPADATEFLADSERAYTDITPQESQFLRDFRDSNDVYLTDTENVGPLLIQAAVIDANRNVVFSGYINHGCNTVEEIWTLAAELCGGKLSQRQALGLRKAFGSPSLKRPVGHDMAWLANQWRQLKESAPSMKVAEWSLTSYDRSCYYSALSRAGFNPQEILPSSSNWVLPLVWMRASGPSLPGYTLGYTCALFAPSHLVWSWHDAVADTLMLFDILTTRQMKLFEGKVELPPADPSICQLFIAGENNQVSTSTRTRIWLADEDRKCYDRLEEVLQENPYATRRSILSAKNTWPKA
ncbi:unnamed protein product [Clonostachys byssicola]|uniref:Uncharacterized protein n=1 Tax=Clonostachys byssicola TaxID=160290 RepID=A0A9N9U5Z4_9HYPO|nr:unnamed protein product [Clonostachys byssicola]